MPSRSLLITVLFAIVVVGTAVPSVAFEDSVIEIALTETGPSQTENRAPLAERMTAWQCPGVCVTMIDDGDIEWTRGFGLLSADHDDPVDGKTVFQAGSVSKFVTAVIVLHCVGEGTLDLDIDVNEYLKSWKMPENEWGTAITLRQLLSHTSGIPGTNFSRDPDRDLPTLPQVLSGEEPARNEAALPAVEPGGDWSYSNVGYVVIQLVLEDALGRSLDAIAREVLFEPLGMASTTFDYPLPETLRKHEALPHADGGVKPVAQDSKARAQGGLMTTTGDLALLVTDVMRAWRGDSAKVLSHDMARLMMEAQAIVPPAAMGVPLSMGLGAFIETSGSSLSFLHAGHSAPGSSFLFAAFPETKQAVVIGINGNMGDLLQLEILATLADAYDLPSGQYFR